MTVQRLRNTYGLSAKGEGKLVSTEVSWYRERTRASGPHTKAPGGMNSNAGQDGVQEAIPFTSCTAFRYRNRPFVRRARQTGYIGNG